jgi:hypothetical protein
MALRLKIKIVQHKMSYTPINELFLLLHIKLSHIINPSLTIQVRDFMKTLYMSRSFTIRRSNAEHNLEEESIPIEWNVNNI